MPLPGANQYVSTLGSQLGSQLVWTYEEQSALALIGAPFIVVSNYG